MTGRPPHIAAAVFSGIWGTDQYSSNWQCLAGTVAWVAIHGQVGLTGTLLDREENRTEHRRQQMDSVKNIERGRWP
jgi:hypothetical protein